MERRKLIKNIFRKNSIKNAWVWGRLGVRGSFLKNFVILLQNNEKQTPSEIIIWPHVLGS